MTATNSDIKPWRVLLVEDTATDAADIKHRLLASIRSEGSLEVETCEDFATARIWLETRRYDLLILDLIDDKRDGWAIGKSPRPAGEEPELAGQALLAAVRGTRPLPVIFHTAHPRRLEFSESVIGKIVTKGEWNLLAAAIDSILATGIPRLMRRIEEAQRSYLWDFIEKHTNQIGSVPMEAAILLARRLAFLLRSETLAHSGSSKPELAQAVEYYIYPRDEGCPQVGDIYQRQGAGKTDYYLLLTPSCDMVPGRVKCKRALLATCDALTDRSVFKDWKANPDAACGGDGKRTTTDVLHAYLTGRQPQEDRTFFLPPAFALPALLADFQHCIMVDFKELGTSLKRVATLDSPFAEAAAARFARYYGRLGTPDLDLGGTLKKLVSPNTTPTT